VIIKDFLVTVANVKAVNKNNIKEVITIITNLMQAIELDADVDEYDLVDEQKALKTILDMQLDAIQDLLTAGEELKFITPFSAVELKSLTSAKLEEEVTVEETVPDEAPAGRLL
jgi:hypothetical protein